MPNCSNDEKSILGFSSSLSFTLQRLKFLPQNSIQFLFKEFRKMFPKSIKNKILAMIKKPSINFSIKTSKENNTRMRRSSW